MLTLKNVYRKDRHKMNFVPFIDCVFMLLMYFFVAAEIRPTEGDFDTRMPSFKGPGDPIVPPAVKDVISVWIADDPAGPSVRLGGANSEPCTFITLVNRLRASKNPNSLVMIDGPSNVSMQTVALALDAAVEAEIPSMTFKDPEAPKHN